MSLYIKHYPKSTRHKSTRLVNAKFLLSRQSHDAGVTGEQLTPLHRARLADATAAALHTTGASPTPIAAPPTAPILDELLHLGDAHHDGCDTGDERFVNASSGRIRSRSRRMRRRAYGTTLTLVELSLVLFMPETLQVVIVEEVIVVLVSCVMVAALAAGREHHPAVHGRVGQTRARRRLRRRGATRGRRRDSGHVHHRARAPRIPPCRESAARRRV